MKSTSFHSSGKLSGLLAGAFAAVGIGMATGGTANAAIITLSTSAPSVGAYDVYQSHEDPATNPTANIDPYADAGFGHTNDSTSSWSNPGQLFTTGAAPAGDNSFKLNSITLAGVFNAGDPNPMWSGGFGGTTLTIHIVNVATAGGTTTVTPFDTETATVPTGILNADYFTIALGNSVTLKPNTQYGFDVYDYNGGNYYMLGSIHSGGTGAYNADASNGNGYTGSSTATVMWWGVDRLYYASLTPNTVAVPEPATLGLLAVGGLGILALGKRRRTA